LNCGNEGDELNREEGPNEKGLKLAGRTTGGRVREGLASHVCLVDMSDVSIVDDAQGKDPLVEVMGSRRDSPLIR
jgi:hypothetical protein